MNVGAILVLLTTALTGQVAAPNPQEDSVPSIIDALTNPKIPEKPESTDAQRAKEVEAWRAALDAIAKEHRIGPDGQSAPHFRLVERPVFAWNQPVRLGQIGSVYLWVQEDGRPGAMGTFFCWHRWQEFWAIMHEFHSLAETPLKASFRGQEFWMPTQAGLQWRPLPIETRVATSRTRQLSQIRQLSRRFRAHTLKPDGERWQLRLLPRPLYEYSTNSGDSVRVGAVLALCQYMDPEIVLVIEARSVKDGLAWHYVEHAPDDKRLAAIEAEARKSKRGLWSDSKTPISPWDWRQGERGEDEPPDATGYWLDTESNVRHNSRCQHYRATKQGRECGAEEGKACEMCGG